MRTGFCSKLASAVPAAALITMVLMPSALAQSNATVVTTASGTLGTILNSANHKTLYVFASDAPGKSNCLAACAQNWPPVIVQAGQLKRPAGVTAKLGFLRRSDGKLQLTVNRYPAYTFVGDTAPGAASGQGLNVSGGLWWAVSPQGVALASNSRSSATTSPAQTAPTNPSYNDAYQY